jgi:hypothetical protein
MKILEQQIVWVSTYISQFRVTNSEQRIQEAGFQVGWRATQKTLAKAGGLETCYPEGAPNRRC